MRVYEIFLPEIGTYIKYKVLPPEDISKFIDQISDYPEDDYAKHVLENLVFNMKTEVIDSIKMMSASSGKAALEALYNGCVMLNPGIDIDRWVDLSYGSVKAYESNGALPLPVGTKQEVPKKRKITKAKFANLSTYLDMRVIGQGEAVDTVVNALKRSQAGLNDSHRPLGVFLFAGSSGVGKTHLARELHKYLYGAEYDMVRIDCGEYQHKHDNQKLIGSPPGYVGHDDGGQLSNQVAEHPYTVVLLDEVEKAHPDLFNTFLRVFDEGILTDNKGKRVSFENTIIIMTTNLGNEKVVEALTGKGTGFNQRIEVARTSKVIPPRTQVERFAHEAIKKLFRPEFLNRIDQIVVFNHLTDQDYIHIAQLEMDIVDEKLSKKGIIFKFDDSVLDALIEKGVDTVLGARGMARIRRDEIETKIADHILSTKTIRGSIFELACTDGEFELRVQRPPKKMEAK